MFSLLLKFVFTVSGSALMALSPFGIDNPGMYFLAGLLIAVLAIKIKIKR